MAQTSPVVVAGSSLQISPNLEALLQYDELTRHSSSPTSSRPSLASTSSEFPFSLPPPPPRNSQSSRKVTTPETVSPKSAGRRRGVKLRSDSWPDALLVAMPDSASPVESNTTSATSIPNPFINPTPVVARFDSVIDDGLSTPKPGDVFVPTESPTQASPNELVVSSPESYTSQSSTCHRASPALHKVEKMLSKGKDSLAMFATAATPGSLKQKSDSLDVGRRRYRAETMDADNLPAMRRYLTGTPRLGTSTAYGKGGASSPDTSTITRPYPTKIKRSSGSAGRYTGSPLPLTHPAMSDKASTRSLSISSSTSSCSSLNVTANPARTYPASSLPNLPLSSMTSGKERQHEGSRRDMDNESRHSFIDFYSPSYADGMISCSEHGDNSKKDPPSRKQQLNLTIPSNDIYGTSTGNPSLVSLATMTFAPPSPVPFGESPLQQTPNSPSASSIALSAMIFAPPSPATELPSYGFLRPESPGSAATLTPIECAPPSPPAVGHRRKRELATAFKMASLRVGRNRGGKRSLSLSPRPPSQSLAPMPPTTNLLGRDERADLVRRNRKLAQVFGQTPGHDMSALDLQEPRRLKMPPLALTSLLGAGKQRNHRQAISVSHGPVSCDAKTEPSSPWQIDDSWSLGERRYSIPLTPSSFTFYFDDDTSRTVPTNDHRGVHSLRDSPLQRNSSSSFIDLSDDEEVSRGDEAPAITADGNGISGRRTISHFSSTPSLVDSLDPDRQAEGERRRKRDRLAKLHRFLGSRIPPDLVLGFPAELEPQPLSSSPPMESFHDSWLRGRKGGALDHHEHFDRGKEELDQREKALNVRRAQKMEKVFGTPPPQTLFHTRQGPSTLPHSQPSSPTGLTYTSNPNQSAYKGKSSHRPPLSESVTCLLPKRQRSSISNRRVSIAQSSVYLDYEQSLNSLVDIIDRDDRESLLELHRFINSELPDLSFDMERVADNKRHSVTSSHRSERRHSLPSSASMLSLASEFHSVPHETSEFQVRRRRAAKLTSFFGVDYRDLIDDILESIERGVEEEHTKGTLQPEEAEVLLYKVWSLKSTQGQQS
ncbi:hypothetical protein F5J12DRAFT_818487 [Pisolithus orientalis]|uniref:uncharacterized protein n=1 Tax=Pisolithus orientalis TaxID=936130 RepID=UPI00222595A9|nr:uncharacterized protein F5J12DRAFT_818487 [Pisolithus orientalis]KAI6012528.1 hypothetical protein F5J12DRAFT_818487 [Pisolithus orientalis]